MATPHFLLDRRVAERHIAKGLLKRADYNDAMENLPDVADNAELALGGDSTEESPPAEGEAAPTDG